MNFANRFLNILTSGEPGETARGLLDIVKRRSFWLAFKHLGIHIAGGLYIPKLLQTM